jgi:hypothetical protein
MLKKKKLEKKPLDPKSTNAIKDQRYKHKKKLVKVSKQTNRSTMTIVKQAPH